MKNLTLRQIYLYLVSFVALMLTVTGLIQTLMAAADFILPTVYYVPGPADIYNRFRTPEGKETVPKEVIDQQIQFEISQAKAQSRMGAYQQLKRGVAYIAVALPVWLYHWRKVQSENRLPPSPAA